MPRIRNMRLYDRMLWATIIVVPLVGLYLVMKSVGLAREAARQAQCSCNLCMVAVAFLNYHETYGRFPPAYTVDSFGRPMHSWRTLILPFALSGTPFPYNFDEPWDSPGNLAMIPSIPNFYQCPSDPTIHTNPGMTNYVVVQGKPTAFPGSHSVRIDDLGARMAETLMVVEVKKMAIPWTAPVDLNFETMSFRVNDGLGNGISSHHPGVANVSHFDGRHSALHNTITPEQLRARLTIPTNSR